MRTLLMLITLVLLTDITTGKSLVPPKLTDGVYFPAYVEYPDPLSDFVPPYLHQTCDMLKAGNLPVAEKAFAEEMRKHPDDLAAIIGFLQAAHGHRDGLLPQYRKEFATNPTPANQFKLGLLEFYMYGEYELHSPFSAYTMKLRKLAWANLYAAYKHTGDPAVGLIVSWAGIYIGQGGANINEEIMHRLGGDTVYQAYIWAKEHHWIAPQPPIPHLPLLKLRLFAFVVSEIRADDATRSSPTVRKMVNGVAHSYAAPLPPFTQEQKRAMAFLGEWHRRIYSVVQKEMKKQP